MKDNQIADILDELTDGANKYDDFVSVRHEIEEAEDLFVVRFSGQHRKQSIETTQNMVGVRIRVREQPGPELRYSAYPTTGDKGDPLGIEVPARKPNGAPYIGGDRIMNRQSGGWGTLGLPARYGIDMTNGRDHCSTGRNPCLLSNNHVIARSDSGARGEAIHWLAGTVLDEQIGQLACAIPMNSSPHVDVSLATLTTNNVAWFELGGIGKITGAISRPLYKVQYKKSGARTGLRVGEFAGYGTIKIDGRIYQAVGSITRGFSCQGDSGSIIVDGSMRIIGIVFAGETLPCSKDPYTWFIPFEQLRGGTLLKLRVTDEDIREQYSSI